MSSFFPLNLCGCFGLHRKRRKTVTIMDEVIEPASLTSFDVKNTLQEEALLLKTAMPPDQTESNEDVKHACSSAPRQDPKVVQGVKPHIVLVEGIKCRSQLKCGARPGGYVGPGCSIALGGGSIGNKQIFHTQVIFRSWVLPVCVPVQPPCYIFHLCLKPSS